MRLVSRLFWYLFFHVLYTAVASSSPCLHRIEGSKGIVKSPQSEIVTSCSWQITVPHNHGILMTFTTFELYYKGEDDKSNGITKLQAWDGDSEHNTSLGIFYGTKRPFSLHSSGRHLLLRLTTAQDTPLCNFEGSYISIITTGTVEKFATF